MNKLVVSKNGIPRDIILNSKECQLISDKTNINASWDLCCKSIKSRTGLDIIGNFDLVSVTIEGNTWPLH